MGLLQPPGQLAIPVPPGARQIRRQRTGPREPSQNGRAAWPHCGTIRDIIDSLNEGGSDTELRLLTNRLQRWPLGPRKERDGTGTESLIPRTG